jgi:hypothetical protein
MSDSVAGSATPASATKRSRDDEEEQLRKQLKGHLHRVTKREPLDATYKFFISSGAARPPFIPKDRLYKRLGAELRYTTEKLMLQPGGNDPNLPGKKIGGHAIGPHSPCCQKARARGIRTCGPAGSPPRRPPSTWMGRNDASQSVGGDGAGIAGEGD